MEMNKSSWLDQVQKKGFATVAFQTLAAWICDDASAAMPLSVGCCSCISQMHQAETEPVFNPHHADVLIVSGALSNKAALVVRRIYDQMPVPKYVIAFGNCAVNGGLFADSYAVTTASKIVPVDVCVPGCPPSAESMIAGIKKLRAVIQNKIRNE